MRGGIRLWSGIRASLKNEAQAHTSRVKRHVPTCRPCASLASPPFAIATSRDIVRAIHTRAQYLPRGLLLLNTSIVAGRTDDRTPAPPRREASVSQKTPPSDCRCGSGYRHRTDLPTPHSLRADPSPPFSITLDTAQNIREALCGRAWSLCHFQYEPGYARLNSSRRHQ